MVVPTVGIVIGDHDRHVFPLRELLERVNRLHQKLLFREGRGIGRMARFRTIGLEKAHGRHVAVLWPDPEIVDRVVMIRLIGGSSDGGRRTREQMVRIRSAGVILEGIIVAVIRCGTRCNNRLAGGGLRKVGEKPSPGNTLLVQEVANIRA